MIDYDRIDTIGLVRIYNYYENDLGYGSQIVENDMASILDMKDNFSWDCETIIKILISNEYKNNHDYLLCDNKGFESIDTEETRDLLINFLENIGTPNGELQEIIDEEFYFTNEFWQEEENE